MKLGNYYFHINSDVVYQFDEIQYLVKTTNGNTSVMITFKTFAPIVISEYIVGDIQVDILSMSQIVMQPSG